MFFYDYNGAPGRREIGHGALGEKALAQVIPSEDEFPYTIRISPMAIPATGAFIGTPAAIKDIHPAQILACDDEPFDSSISLTTRIVYRRNWSLRCPWKKRNRPWSIRRKSFSPSNS